MYVHEVYSPNVEGGMSILLKFFHLHP